MSTHLDKIYQHLFRDFIPKSDEQILVDNICVKYSENINIKIKKIVEENTLYRILRHMLSELRDLKNEPIQEIRLCIMLRALNTIELIDNLSELTESKKNKNV